jgi:hypothetical protein
MYYCIEYRKFRLKRIGWVRNGDKLLIGLLAFKPLQPINRPVVDLQITVYHRDVFTPLKGGLRGKWPLILFAKRNYVVSKYSSE